MFNSSLSSTIALMSLQDTFYVVAIAFMVLHILLLIGIAIILFIIKRKISEVTNNVEERFYSIKDAFFNPGEIVRGIGTIVANKAFEKISNFAQNKRRKK